MAAGFTRRTTAVLAMAAAVLCGCTEEKRPAETLPDASSSSSTSSEALPPLGPPDFPVPDEAREKTPEGALEFTRYYIALGAHIAEGPSDPQPLLDLSRDCAQCRMVAASYEEDWRAGHTYGEAEFDFVAAGPGVLEEDIARVSFVYSQSALAVYASDGTLVSDRSSAALENLQSGAQLQWDSSLSCWLITTLTIG